MTDIYMRNENLKRTGQLRNVRVESGFVTVCPTRPIFMNTPGCQFTKRNYSKIQESQIALKEILVSTFCAKNTFLMQI